MPDNHDVWGELAGALERSEFGQLPELAGKALATAGESPELKVLREIHAKGGFERLAVTGAESRAKWLAEQIVVAGQNKQRSAAEDLAFSLRELLAKSGVRIDDELAIKALNALRRLRAFEALAYLGDRMIALGAEEPEVRKLVAQGLIDYGYPRSALATLDKMLADTPQDHPQHIDGCGLAGRAYKQVYVDAQEKIKTSGSQSALRQALARSVRSYEEGYFASVNRPDTPIGQWSYHAINLVAVLERARRDGITVHSRVATRKLTDQLIEGFGANGENAAGVWDKATLGEVYVARGDWLNAERWFRMFATADDVDAFALAGAIRQLEQVWQLDMKDEPQRQLLYFLNGQLLIKSGGEITLTPESRHQLAQARLETSGQLEAFISEGRPKPLSWFRTGLECANSVGLVKRISNGQGFGTGFLARGGDFIPSLGDQPVFVTNAHVISERSSELGDPSQPSVHTKKAKVEFTEAGAAIVRREFTFRRILWDSPRHELDCTILELHPDPKDIPVRSLSERDPTPGKSRVIVVGHPGGEREMKISLFEAPVLRFGIKGLLNETGNAGAKFLHYTNPTIGGNSGSPVFDIDDWQVIGLHHAGPTAQSVARAKQGVAGEDQPGNEGIFIRSITEAAARDVTGRTVMAAPSAPAAVESVAAGKGVTVESAPVIDASRLPVPGVLQSVPEAEPESGPGALGHDIPKEMRQGRTATVTVALSRTHSERLMAGMRAADVSIHEVMTHAAMSVGLRAPDGGFRIEPINSETQWIDRKRSRLDDVTKWQWLVTPIKVGVHPLLLVVQGREFRDGIEAALPSTTQNIEVKVRVDKMDRSWAVAKWASIAAGGGLLSVLGQMVARIFLH